MTIRNPNIKTEFQGVRHVQGVVQDNHSIFQSFDRENDQGNDCYVEFVLNGIATNYGIFAQIKSGPSYKDGKGYKIPANNSHLTYWSQALYQTIGIVYDPSIKKSYWVDISAYLRAKPQVLKQKHHSIRIDIANEFSEDSFAQFMNYCFEYKAIFTSYENFGRSLEWFSNLNEPDICYEGLKSLYSNHRNKSSTWFYIISNFSKITEDGIRRNILGLISNYVNNPHTFWHTNNIQYFPTKEMQNNISDLMTNYFRTAEVELSIPYMEQGINRGSFSFLIYLVIDLVKDVHIVLKELSFKKGLAPDKRNFCFWLYMHFSKCHSIDDTLKTADDYLAEFPYGYEDEALLGVRENLRNGQIEPVG